MDPRRAVTEGTGAGAEPAERPPRRSTRRAAERFPVAAAAEQALDRRRFLGAAAAAAALACAGEWAASALAAVSEAPLTVALEPGTPLAIGEARGATAPDGRQAIVVRLGSGLLVAFDRRCPHLGCPVLWSAAHARFECPCHHAAFDAESGRVLFGPPRRGLRPARLQGDTVALLRSATARHRMKEER